MSTTRPRKKHAVHPEQIPLEISPKPVARKKATRPKLKVEPKPARGWAVMGFDTSMSSLAGAGIGYDRILGKFLGPVFTEIRWQKGEDYFNRLRDAAKAHELVLSLIHQLGISLELDEIFIAQEEPWPMALGKMGESSFLKQQAEISGAFLGGLVRYGYTGVSQINSMRWRTMIAHDLGITTHHSKWRSPELALKYNCRPTDSGKFRTKQWALSSPGPGYAFMGFMENEIPDWPDIINSSDGKKPRPERSVAKAVQPDDRYDALAIMYSHYIELSDMGLIPGNSADLTEESNQV